MWLPRTAVAVAALTVLWAPTAHSHLMWIFPSATVLSGQDPWVTVDGAVSNELFYPDHQPLRMDGVKVTGPDGAAVAAENVMTGKYRSTFDIHLTKPGTYKISNGGGASMLGASWKVGGETKRWRGSQAELAAAIPKDATDVRIMQNSRRGETFVTRGAPNLVALAPTGQGLELEPITHPNDLVVSEKARFRFLMDGKPAPGLEITVAEGGSRYRPSKDFKVTTSADGVAEITWREAGMYWIEASVRGGKSEIPNAERSAGYTATFEVLPD